MKLFIPLFLLIFCACHKKEDVKPLKLATPTVSAPKYGILRVEVSPNPTAHIVYEWKIKVYASDSLIGDYTTITPLNSSGTSSKEFNVQDNKMVTVAASLSNSSLCSTPVRVKIYYDEGKILLKDTTITNACNTNGVVTASANLPNYGN